MIVGLHVSKREYEWSPIGFVTCSAESSRLMRK